MNQDYIKKIHTAFTLGFQDRFQDKPIMISAPGRINMLGEHTDYNEGLVLPAAVDRMTYLAMASNGTRQCEVIAYDLDDRISFNIDDELCPKDQHWSNYVVGVVNELKKLKKSVSGFNCVFGGNIPIGAGMSSSAALECGIIFGLNQLFDLGMDRMEIALAGQAAEHHFVGVKCGIMDQFANMFGKHNNAIELDCKTMEFKYHPSSFQNVSLILFDSCVHHSLGDSEYNQRRKECEIGVNALHQAFPEINSLRDASLAQLEQVSAGLSPNILKRCEYIIKESQRVKEAAKALEQGAFVTLGKIMYTTHAGLSQDYEVSCEELDFLVQQSRYYPEILGARMMGGGFGGCTLNLVLDDHPENMIVQISRNFEERFGHSIKVYPVNIAEGTSVISVSQ
ncbi:MAG: galactokinase [Cytophagales bacterium]|nr:galactokinase [Cytophagales bacterium]